jgi:hypothetical protein
MAYGKQGVLFEYMKAPAGIVGPIKSLWRDFRGLLACTRGDTENCIFFTMWEEPSIVNKTQAITVNMKAINKNIDSDGSFNIKITLDVNNKYVDFLEVIPKCYVDGQEVDVEGLESYAQGIGFVFPKSETTRHTSFYCSGSVEPLPGTYTKKLEVVLERPMIVLSHLPVWLQKGSEHQRGVQSSFMENWAPYTFAIASLSDQPFDVGDYGFSLILKQVDDDSELKSIEWIRVMADSERVSIDCDDFDVIGDNDLQIEDINKNELLKYSTKRTIETYMFNCKLHVLNAPSEEEKAFIRARTLYIVETKERFILKGYGIAT